MPELPEVETIRRALEKSLINRKIKEVFVRKDKMVLVGSAKVSNLKKGSASTSKKFAAGLKGKKVISVGRRAKYLLIGLSGGDVLAVHLRMSGQILHREKGQLGKFLKLSSSKNAIQQALPNKHTHVEIVFSDGSKLFYNDIRQFGHLRLASPQEMRSVLETHALGPEPLGLSLKDFERLIQENPKRRIKDFLLDQKIIAGIGNIYADEALFAARILPDRKTGSLSSSEVKALLASIKKILNAAIRAGGSSMENFLNLNGESGRYGSKHKVYGRSGKACKVCGTILQSKKIGSRTSTFCPNCQK